MKFGIGTDIEKASRFRTKNKTFLKKFLSERELRSIRNRNAGHIAGIFCAKEAVIKACSEIERLHFEHIEVLHNKNGSPYIMLKGCKKLASKNIKISISPSKDYGISADVLFIN